MTTPDYTSRRGARTVRLEDNDLRLAHVLEYLDSDQPIARIEWDQSTGEILHLWVKGDHRRQGIATALWRLAEALGATHSAWRTVDGQKWATSLGDELPPWRLA